MNNELKNSLGAVAAGTKLCHYTTLSAFVDGIVLKEKKDKYCFCMRATHYEYLNDPTELSSGFDTLKEFYQKMLLKQEVLNIPNKWDDFLQQLKQQYKESYIFSLSSKDDYLPMWNAYGGKGQGLEICFKDVFKDFQESAPPHNECIVCRCQYDAQMVLKELLRNPPCSMEQVTQDLHVLYAPFLIKHPAYLEEQEVRLIGKFTNSDTGFREKNGIVIPYKNLYFMENQVEFIRIGPASNQNEVEKALRRYLGHKGLSKVKIVKSDIPYRNI